MKVTKTCFVVLFLMSPLAALAAEPVDSGDRIRPWSSNRFYWQYRGRPVLLVGGSDDDNLFQWPDDRLKQQLDLLADCGGNFIRNTMSDRPDHDFEVYAFKRLADGRYDLNKWNDEYWRRFARLLSWTEKRGIIVQIEVWDRFDYGDFSGHDFWQRHPYNPKNNTNYDYKESGFAKRYPDHPGANNQPFFFTTPLQRNNQTVLKYQQRFVEKLLEIALPHGNVLYCIDNETSGDELWGKYWATFIRERAKRAGVTVCITEMWDDWNVTGGRHVRTFDHPELYDFVDISQNNHNKHDRHWKNMQVVRKLLAKQPRPINTVKTYGADRNKFGHSDNDGLERYWRHLLGGAASARFHRPPSGLGLGDKAQATIRAVRKVEQLTPFWELEPSMARLFDRKPNEAYAASRPGRAHVVYFPGGGQVRLKATAGAWRLGWLRIDKIESREPNSIESNGSVSLKVPGKGHWVAVLSRD